ncbi:hypothetical protein TRICI_004187 [Trichomonascus ciferrii]|uniref:Trimethylguanosine synthase n=1 Tax=Trichomonascus ciferrii TaxID=44093 RepID=A0A642V1E9_9ASCO|nr:hypothetical protein TRICI_004187 [Trichomonascus ciferrii]
MRKKRRGNSGEGRNAVGELPKELRPYYYKRHTLFSKYDQGIQLNHEQWYSVTPESIARITAVQLRLRYPDCETVLDAFGGAGGNSIQFALHLPNKVYHCELDPETSRLATHNAKVYGVKDKIEFINRDFYSLDPNDIKKVDHVFISLPWGGPSYLKLEYWDLHDHGVFKAVDHARKFSRNISLFLPKSSKLDQVAELVDNNDSADVDYMFVRGYCKGICVYIGPDLVHNSYSI